MKTSHITFKGPQVSNVLKTKSSITFDATHITNDVAKIKITRVKKGWVYEDLGMITRLFTDTEYLRWEYEYPVWLGIELKKLKPTKYSFTEGMTENAMERLMSDLQSALK
jgi:hypothetical protein